MTLRGKQLFVCNCNATMALDPHALAQGLQLADAPIVHTQLCQKQLAAFADHAAGDVLVACTQEAPLFGDIADESPKVHTIGFVNIRETAGWSSESRTAMPKIAALIAAAALPEPDPVPRVTFSSEGQLLIVGPAAVALAWAERLHNQLSITLLITDTRAGIELPHVSRYPIFSGNVERMDGWLGAFDVTWRQQNPIDLDVCTRCNACIDACPENAIDYSYQIDLERCKDHRACVTACGAVAAIDFDRRDAMRTDRFDLVLDLDAQAHFQMHQPPQGYWHPGNDPFAQATAAVDIASAIGSFEKPKYFAYKASICAHSRSHQPGCNQCIDVCSTQAIRGDGDHIAVEPHLCMGCGACTTVCPSGALSYAYPTVPELGKRIRTLLATHRATGGRDGCLLFHDAAGGELINRLGRRGRGLPARVIPVAVHHMVACGLDVWLGAIAYGATDVAVLASGDVAPQYRAAVAREMGFAQPIVEALGYQGRHFHLLQADDAVQLELAVWELPAALGVRRAATFDWTSDKRTTVALAVEHLRIHAPTPVDEIALGAGAPFGAIVVDRDACTLCLACVGACPEGAIMDLAETPQLRFIESKCVQCGICAATCPEHAISLQPRLLLSQEAKQPRVLNEAAIFACIRCAKPLGTEKMIANIIAKLSGHSMFTEPRALERLKMCADCRVIDMMEKEDGVLGPSSSAT